MLPQRIGPMTISTYLLRKSWRRLRVRSIWMVDNMPKDSFDMNTELLKHPFDAKALNRKRLALRRELLEKAGLDAGVHGIQVEASAANLLGDLSKEAL